MQITSVIQMLRAQRAYFVDQDDDGAALLPLAAPASTRPELSALPAVERVAPAPLTLERLEQAQSAPLRRAA